MKQESERGGCSFFFIGQGRYCSQEKDKVWQRQSVMKLQVYFLESVAEKKCTQLDRNRPHLFVQCMFQLLLATHTIE